MAQSHFLWLVPCLLLVAAGSAWRWPTLHHVADYAPYAFSRLAYSDVIHLYLTRHLAAHHIPYVQQDVEYPVLTGLTMWLTAYVPALWGYFLVNVVLLGACLVACGYVLARLAPAGIYRFAAAPPLALYVCLNWDGLALIAVAATLLFCERSLFGRAGVALAIGTWAKIFPLFLLPLVWAVAARRDRLHPGAMEGGSVSATPGDNTWRLFLSFSAVSAATNLPFLVANPTGWVYFITFQGGRGINPDSIWAHVPGATATIAGLWFATIFVAGWVWISLRVRSHNGAGWQAAGLSIVLVFLLFTKDYSPQYDLWLLPFLAVLRCPWPLWGAFVLADATYYVSIFLYLALQKGAATALPLPHRETTLGLTVWARELVLAGLFVWSWQLVRRARTVSPGARGGCRVRERVRREIGRLFAEPRP